MRPLLSKEQDESLKKEYPSTPTNSLAKKYGLTLSRVYVVARRLNVHKNYDVRYSGCIGQWFNKPIISPPRDEVSYIAGFIDGDGGFHIARIVRKRGKKKGKITFCPSVYAGCTDKNVIHFIKDRLGGTSVEVQPRGKRKTFYNFRTTSIPKIATICRLLLPHLIVKKKHAEIMLAWCERRMEKCLQGNRRFDEKDLELIKELRKLSIHVGNRRAVALI